MGGHKSCRLKAAALCIVPTIVLSAFVFFKEIPNLRLGGVLITERSALPRVGQFPIRIADGTSIKVLGDSNSTGSRVGGQEYAWPALLQGMLGSFVSIENHAVGGAIVQEPLTNCAESVERVAKPALVVIMFGTNDAAPRRWLGSHRVVSPDKFRTRLEALVEACREDEAPVLLLAAPPAGSPAMDWRVQPYRRIAHEVATSKGAFFIDPAEVLSGEILLKVDGLHLNRAAQRKLAGLLHQVLKPVPAA